MPSGPTATLPLMSFGSLGSWPTNRNSPRPLPRLPHRRMTFPLEEMAVTRWFASVTYRFPFGPIASERGFLSPSDFALQRAVILKGVGRDEEPVRFVLPPQKTRTP